MPAQQATVFLVIDRRVVPGSRSETKRRRPKVIRTAPATYAEQRRSFRLLWRDARRLSRHVVAAAFRSASQTLDLSTRTLLPCFSGPALGVQTRERLPPSVAFRPPPLPH